MSRLFKSACRTQLYSRSRLNSHSHMRITPIAILASPIAMLCWGSAAASCIRTQRAIGAFGAEKQFHARQDTSLQIKSQLPDFVRSEGSIQLPDKNDLQVFFYDTSSDDTDPHPRVAIIVRDHVQETADLDELTETQGGFTLLLGACTFQIEKGRAAVAVAVSNGFDGAETAFAIFEARATEVGHLLTAHGQQARMEIAADRLSITEARARNECVWCPHHYVTQRYRFNGKMYVKSGPSKVAGQFEPAAFSARPVELRIKQR